MRLYDIVQALVIALCIGASCAYLVRSYAPRLWGRAVGAVERLLPAALRCRLEARAATRSPSASSACDRCGACPPAARRR